MSARLTADGATRLTSTAHTAADRARRVVASWGDEAGTIVLAAVDPPIDTGRLASTVHLLTTPQGFAIAAGGPRAPYVAIVNARHPFLTEPFRARETAVLDAAADQVADLLGTLKGS